MARPREVYGVDPADTIESNADLIIPARVADLLVWERYISDPSRVREIHQMRIAAKRLRYTMELFAPFYGSRFREAIEKVKSIQEHIGALHDADVLTPQLQEYLRHILQASKKEAEEKGVYTGDFDSASGLLLLCRKKRDERKARYRQFLAEWKALRASGFFESLKPLMKDESSNKETEGEKSNGKQRSARANSSEPVIQE
jgi:CHAD domain-containing protein